jgi:hypothetical protein
MRVNVWNGDKSEFLGQGDYLKDVRVYFIEMPDGSLRSLTNAEERPTQNMMPPGAKLIATDGNPKIRLDNGKVVYGCQVWWSAAEEQLVAEEVVDDDPWKPSVN